MRNLFLSLVLSAAVISPTLASNHHFAEADAMQLTPLEAAVSNFCQQNLVDFTWETVTVGGVTYRKGEVSGHENNCGLYSLNTLYPNLDLTRENVLASFLEAVVDHSNEHHDMVTTELANEIVYDLLAKITSGDIDSDFPEINEWNALCNKIRRNFNENNDVKAEYFAIAKSSTAILEHFIDLLRNTGELFLALPLNEKCLGTLGLVCKINKRNVMAVVADSLRGEHGTRTFDGDGDLKAIFFRASHFSPMCPLNDLKMRDHFALTYINETILKNVGAFLPSITKHDAKYDSSLNELLAQAKMPLPKQNSPAPVKQAQASPAPAPVKQAQAAPATVKQAQAAPAPVKQAQTAPAPAQVEQNGNRVVKGLGRKFKKII